MKMFTLTKVLVKDDGEIREYRQSHPPVNRGIARLIGLGLMGLYSWAPNTEHVIYSQGPGTSGQWEILDGEELYPED